jgi:hypothetical protein
VRRRHREAAVLAAEQVGVEGGQQARRDLLEGWPAPAEIDEAAVEADEVAGDRRQAGAGVAQR